MPAPPNAALRRFAALWSISLAVKLVAVALLLFVVFKLLGGF